MQLLQQRRCSHHREKEREYHVIYDAELAKLFDLTEIKALFILTKKQTKQSIKKNLILISFTEKKVGWKGFFLI
jgi:hypothetical protein